MKYNAEQFAELKKALKVLAQIWDLEKCNVWTMHYTVFCQYSKGLEHNKLYKHPIMGIKRKYQFEDLRVIDECKPLIDSSFDFVQYPNGCNDTNIETAMKKAIKEILSE